ncbi:hypothetical protein DPMN_179671 [Dreissena polymorpha]|uniref:Uncharacterized protein n=1 Tax=Dreissena polymorpha TaxID=45954 RepID=A0A9D4EHM5_DREPO|nr:hypothetical protein DPMN_179671 [Dreissena polymorpha]
MVYYINPHCTCWVIVNRYVKQVLDETLRCAIVVTLAGRFMDEDVTINGYVIPKNVRIRETSESRSDKTGHNACA